MSRYNLSILDFKENIAYSTLLPYSLNLIIFQLSEIIAIKAFSSNCIRDIYGNLDQELDTVGYKVLYF